MKVLILAGGLGTRISEESHLKPKPMIEVGEMPILWHIMKSYSSFGFNEFIILAGYKQYVIKEYFANYFLHNADITFDMKKNTMEVHNSEAENWKVTVVDTGLHTMTGGRIKRVEKYLKDEPFMLTYGDGVSDVDLNALLDFHKKKGKPATITMVNLTQQKGVWMWMPKGRFVLSGRRKKKTEPLSMAVSWFLSRRFSPILMEMRRFWSRVLCRSWLRKGSFRAIIMRAFGSVWIHKERRSFWRSFGLAERHHGRGGKDEFSGLEGILCRKEGFCYRTYRL